MLQDIENFAPIAVALDQIESSESPAFVGVDLETGRRVRVTFEREAACRPPLQNDVSAAGLVLLMSVRRLAIEA